MTEMPRRDSVSMLRLLPPVFDLRDVEATFALQRDHAKTYCSRWASRKLVSPVGPRAGVFFNLILDPQAPSTRIEEAVRRLARRPIVVIGATSLHQHGWTTQRPHSIEVAYPRNDVVRGMPSAHGVVATGRSLRWFHAVMPAAVEGIDGFMVVPPEYALVDAIMAERADGLWNPDPSDIELPGDVAPEDALKTIEEAARSLGADDRRIRAFVGEMEAFDGQMYGEDRVQGHGLA